MPSRERVLALVAMVEKSQFIEAIEEFYHPHASMQENQEPPRVGRDRLIAEERITMARFGTMTTHPVETLLVDGDQSLIRWRFEFVPPQGPPMMLEELALQRWEGERIVEERFFYDTRQTRPPKPG
jgi:ketosteroid isomerase-like protein